jgi:5'-nucleotidase
MKRLERRPSFAFPVLVASMLVASLLVASMLVPGHLLAQEAKLRILVTNDDGWDAQGLAALVGALAPLGEVVVAAPAANASGSSQAVTSLGEPIVVRRVTIAGASEAYAVAGEPAVAALFGILELGGERPFDAVVSGINRGANVGAVSHLSGTVGAAMQAAEVGIPAFAVSQDHLAGDYTVAATFTARLLRQALDQGFPAGLVLSINVPAKATTGESPAAARAVVRPMGGSYYLVESFNETGRDDASGTTTWRAQRRLVTSPAGFEGTDTGAYLEGTITVTPLEFDWTARDHMKWVEGLLGDG